MDARERLRLYLEQRRELGESELVLDRLPMADALALIGATRPAGARKASPRRPSAPTPSAAEAPANAPLSGVVPDRAPESPVAEAPVAESPVAEAPVAEAPVAEAPVAEAPVTESPVTEPASGALRPGDPGAPGDPIAPPVPTPRFDPSQTTRDWRSALRTEGVAGETTAPAAATPPADGAAPAWLTALEIPLGLAVGASRLAPPTAASLAAVATAVATCTACPLAAGARQAVPGEGNPDADFVCVGEGPGQQEDETGRPFVGPAGDLLTKILASIQFTRAEIYICNVVKHRPPGNRTPVPPEIQACRPYLEQQLGLLRPRVILALGSTAANALLGTTQSLGSLRGHIHRYHGVPVVVTYHPAALLRNEAWKRPAWLDVQLARRIHDAARAASAP